MIIEYCNEFAADSGIFFELNQFKSGAEFWGTFEKGLYSIIFLDIYMSDMNGIETARKLRKKDTECILIFLTSSQDFMPDAFSFHAFEYIMKPFTRERIFQVLGDALKVIPDALRIINITCQRRTIPILVGDIMAAVSNGHYMEISLKEGTSLRSRMTARELLSLIGSDPRFLSVNKGIILNADYIQTIEDQCCTLINDVKFPIRVRDRLQVEHFLQNYNFEKLRNMQRRSR